MLQLYAGAMIRDDWQTLASKTCPSFVCLLRRGALPWTLQSRMAVWMQYKCCWRTIVGTIKPAAGI